ncbi:hypothetical protein JMG10_07750 [Nostoc ellipsosporum NOK]|nr:hypothetical protein [Nostoc ellipsosporum NOK]
MNKFSLRQVVSLNLGPSQTIKDCIILKRSEAIAGPDVNYFYDLEHMFSVIKDDGEQVIDRVRFHHIPERLLTDQEES